jgi:hypothetical protein
MLRIGFMGFIVFSCACGGRDVDRIPPDSGGADTAPTMDTGPTPDTGPAGDANVPAGATRVSYVSAYNYAAGTVESSSVTAGLYDIESGLTSSIETMGACEVETTSFGMAGGLPDYADAGAITIGGGLQTVVLANGPGGYMAFTSEAALWAGGETLTVSGAGAEIPAFEAMITAPQHLEITAPLYTLGMPLDVDRASDLTLTWTGTSAGQLRVRFSGPQELPMPQITVTCHFDPAAGTATIPAAALSQIEPAGTGTVSVDTVSSTEVTVAGWGIVRVSANTPALRPVRQYSTSVEYR